MLQTIAQLASRDRSFPRYTFCPSSTSRAAVPSALSKKTNLRHGESACLNCGERLTYCGKPFSADIECPKCGSIHRFVNSQYSFTSIHFCHANPPRSFKTAAAPSDWTERI